MPDYLDIFAAPRVPLYLAPQAGVSESPFRRLCRAFGADVVVSEFVSAEAIVRKNERTMDYLRFDEAERPIGVQIFGADPAAMGDAAAFVTDAFRPDFVDINFGCPVKKVVKRNGGSGCLRDLSLVADIIRAVEAATPLPVTAKIRSGFDESTRDPVRIARTCEDAGAQVITLHPRTRADMYSGHARWSEIAAIKQAVSVPVVGNGDIRSGADAARMRDETGCDGIMIARGSHGDPWIFKQARAALDGLAIPPGPTVEQRFDVCLTHAQNAIDFDDVPERAVREFRKHLGWYTKGLPNGKALRQELFQVTSLADMREHLERYLDEARERGWADQPVDEGALADGVEPQPV